MAIFDDPRRELNRLQEQLLEDEDDFREEFDEEDFTEEYDYAETPRRKTYGKPRPRSNRGLILIILAELAGICLIAAYWLRVIL